MQVFSHCKDLATLVFGLPNERVAATPANTTMTTAEWLCTVIVHYFSASDGLLSPKGVNYEVAALMSIEKEIREDRHVMDEY